ncbi:hypothetical protein J8J27_25495, partial [Mycobacterium tuberculosis]|nr:hypothetical protein [Mycobacterium tuberculosis]
GDLVRSRDEAALLVSIGNLVTLAVAAGATIVLGAARPTTEPAAPPVPARPAGEDEAAILADVGAALDGAALWRDPDLTLDRLARKAGWPARAISAAVNR